MIGIVKTRLLAQIEEHRRGVEEATEQLAESALEIGRVVAEAFREGGTLFIFGNGGSAADAQHMAAEFINRYRLERPPLPAVALTTDTSTLTSISNDYNFQDVFAKQLRALARPGDVALGITTSGNSTNVLEGLRVAREAGCRTVALLGRNGGEARKLADHAFIAPMEDTGRIQELHLLLEHLVCDVVEYLLFIEPSANRRAEAGEEGKSTG